MVDETQAAIEDKEKGGGRGQHRRAVVVNFVQAHECSMAGWTGAAML